MTNAEFIVRLRKAKKIAMKLYPNVYCIYDALNKVSLYVGHFGENTVYFGWSTGWVEDHCKSPADIALVFDNSIADRQREIEKGNP